MSLFNDLLEADVAKSEERPTKEVEIKSLSKKLGKKAVVTIQAVDPARNAEIQRKAVTFGKNGTKDIDIFLLHSLTVVEGVKEPNLRDKQLLAHFNASTPKELVKKLFLAGEIADLYTEIMELSGYVTDDEDEEATLKN